MFRLVSAAEGRAVLTAPDGFTRRLGAFERGVRMGLAGPATAEAFRDFLGANVQDWPQDLAYRLRRSLLGAGRVLARFAPLLPRTIPLVHSTGREEADCGYTRGDAIVLPPAKAEYPVDRLVPFLVHEAFHLLTRRDAALRDRLYALLGFRPCGPVPLPAAWEPWRITNPDAPVNEHVLDAEVDGSKRALLPVLHWAEPRCLPGPYFEHIRLSLLEVRSGARGWEAVPDRPLLPAAALQDRFRAQGLPFEQPEEMLAEVFVRLALSGQGAAGTLVEDLAGTLAGQLESITG